MIRFNSRVRPLLPHRRALALTAAGAIAALGCGAQPDASDDEPEVVSQVVEPLVTTIVDDSASPVHVQIKKCSPGAPAANQTVDCTLDSGFVLVGGGAHAPHIQDHGGARSALTMSAPLGDGRTWRASSREVSGVGGETVELISYAIGLRLDGVSATTLRSKLALGSVTVPPASQAPQGSRTPSLSMGGSPFLLGGGVSTSTAGTGQFLTRFSPSGTSWVVASRDYNAVSPGQITGTIIFLVTTGIIEGFGAVEVRRRTGPIGFGTPSTNQHGLSRLSVTPGWAIAGLGGRIVPPDNGPGRLLIRVAPDTVTNVPQNARDFVAESTSFGQQSSGGTELSLTEIRKTPGSHGLCTTGERLAASMDTCVASICAQDPFCCNFGWDQVCVNEVTSICGRSCPSGT